MAALSTLFTAHPKAAGESYFEHMVFALRFSGRLFRAAFAALAHGLVPGVCETTASQTVLQMNDELRARRALLAASPKISTVATATWVCRGAEPQKPAPVMPKDQQAVEKPV